MTTDMGSDRGRWGAAARRRAVRGLGGVARAAARVRRLVQPRSYQAARGPAEPVWEGPQQSYGLLSGWLIDARTQTAAAWVTGESVLDLGCNIADLARAIPPNVDYVGVEVVPEIAALARALHPDRRFLSFDIEAPWPAAVTERAFDHVALLAVLEHLKRPGDVLRQAAAVLRPGGTVIATTPHPRARWVHATGARLRLFSRDADEEHEAFLGQVDLAVLARDAGLSLAVYRTFLLGLNQLAVMRRDA